MERGASPGQYKGKKCLTRLCKNYMALKKGHSHDKDENLTLTDEWDDVKAHLKRPREGGHRLRNVPPPRGRRSCAGATGSTCS